MTGHVYSRIRLKFACWNCERHYELTRKLPEDEPTLNVACPFCDAEGIADLSPYQQKPTVARKASKADPPDEKTPSTKWKFPEVIPTTSS